MQALLHFLRAPKKHAKVLDSISAGVGPTSFNFFPLRRCAEASPPFSDNNCHRPTTSLQSSTDCDVAPRSLSHCPYTTIQPPLRSSALFLPFSDATTPLPPLRRSPRRRTPPESSPANSTANSPVQRSRQVARRDLADDGAANIQRRLNIEPGHDEDLEMIDLVPDDMAKAFTFLKRQSRAILRNIGRKWNRRGTGNKKEFLYRNLLFPLDGKRAGRDVALMLKDNASCPSFEDFLKVAEGGDISFETCPSEEAIRLHLRSIGDLEEDPTNDASKASGTPDADAENRGTPYFSISEFARLFIMMRDDHVCKQALLNLTQSLKRADFESGRTRESFWKEIEKRFNDHSLNYYENFEGSVPEANSAASPLCYRKFDVLKTQLQNARKSFTIVYANYSKSGQNDPDKWPEFLTKDRNGEFVAASKKCYIIFVACKLGDECGQDMFLLNATTKTFSGGEDEGPEDETSTGSSGTKRKRTSSDAFNVAMEKRWSSLQKFMDDTRKIGEAIQESVSVKQRSLSNDFAEVAERNKVLEVPTSAYNAYKDAKATGADPKLIGFLQANYERAMNKYSDLEARSQDEPPGQ